MEDENNNEGRRTDVKDDEDELRRTDRRSAKVRQCSDVEACGRASAEAHRMTAATAQHRLVMVACGQAAGKLERSGRTAASAEAS